MEEALFLAEFPYHSCSLGGRFDKWNQDNPDVIVNLALLWKSISCHSVCCCCLCDIFGVAVGAVGHMAVVERHSSQVKVGDRIIEVNGVRMLGDMAGR